MLIASHSHTGVALVVLAGLCRSAAAQTETAAPPPPVDTTTQPVATVNEPEDRWKLRIEPGIWYLGISGDLQLPRSSGPNGSAPINDLGIDSPRVSPMATVRLNRGNWGFTVRGFIFSSDADATATVDSSFGDVDILSGNESASSLDFVGIEFEGTYRAYEFKGSRRTSDGTLVFQSSLEAVFGARMYSVDWTVTNTTAQTAGLLPPERITEDESERFVEPLIGARFAMEFYEQAEIGVQITVGGLPMTDQSSTTLDVVVGGVWKPTRNIGVWIGYRALFFDLSSGEDAGEFLFDGSGQGLCAGVYLEF